MKENPFREEREEIEELLRQFENLKAGIPHSFLDEDAFEMIIDHYDDNEEVSKALEAAFIAVERYPYSSILLLKKADLLIASNLYLDALEDLRHAEVLDAGDINLVILKTEVFLALKEPEKAIQVMDLALDNFDADEKIELLFELADVFDDYEEFDKVFDCLKHILKIDPVNEEALFKICFWTDFTGRYEESIKLHNKIINNHPFSEVAWFNLGASFQGLKLYEKAIEAYNYSVAIDDKMDYAYRNMADAFIRIRKYKEAIEALNKVLDLTRPEYIVLEALGYCFEKLKKQSVARQHYRKAAHLNPDDSRIYYRIALTYMSEGNWANAIKQLESAVNIDRKQSDYFFALGTCNLNLGDAKSAIQYFSQAVNLRPKSIRNWQSLIKSLYKEDLFDEAIVQCRAALEITNGKPVFLYYLSAILIALGKHKEAILKLERAMEKNPKLIKEFVALNPKILQNNLVVDLIARYKRNKHI